MVTRRKMAALWIYLRKNELGILSWTSRGTTCILPYAVALRDIGIFYFNVVFSDLEQALLQRRHACRGMTNYRHGMVRDCIEQIQLFRKRGRQDLQFSDMCKFGPCPRDEHFPDLRENGCLESEDVA